MNQISSSKDENEKVSKRVEKMKTLSSTKLEKAKRENNMKKKVRFKIQDGKGSDGNSTSGFMRIRLVVSKEELKRVLSNKNVENAAKNTSLMELLNDMKLREKSVSKIEEIDGGLNSWRPGLDSIPEDYSMKL